MIRVIRLRRCENHTQELVNAVSMKERTYGKLEEIREKVVNAKKNDGSSSNF